MYTRAFCQVPSVLPVYRLSVRATPHALSGNVVWNQVKHLQGQRGLGLSDLPVYRNEDGRHPAGVTAWNALYGLRALKAGEVVLTQGTGGVALFAIQLAKAAGATVIATTSSESKAGLLRSLGADHIINYRDVPEWGVEARRLTGEREGVDHVIEIGGPGTMAQSIKATKIDGIISVIGWLSKADVPEPSFLETVSNVITVRGLFVASRQMLEDMVAALDAIKLKPVIDDRVFQLSELKEAYAYLKSQQHVGKVIVMVD